MYGRELTKNEIASGSHRNFIGGMWEEIGTLQFEFLKQQGLGPHHTFLDVGCGALRGGLHFIGYLEPGLYHGLDINVSLLQAAVQEVAKAKLDAKQPKLMYSDKFEFFKFENSFDYALALSVFTHLPANHIIRCLVEMKKVLKTSGRFFATYFEAPTPAHLDPLPHEPGGIVTNYDRDPFHYHFTEMEWFAKSAGLRLQSVSDFQHPRAQQMLSFSLGQDS